MSSKEQHRERERVSFWGSGLYPDLTAGVGRARRRRRESIDHKVRKGRCGRDCSWKIYTFRFDAELSGLLELWVELAEE